MIIRLTDDKAHYKIKPEGSVKFLGTFIDKWNDPIDLYEAMATVEQARGYFLVIREDDGEIKIVRETADGVLHYFGVDFIDRLERAKDYDKVHKILSIGE